MSRYSLMAGVQLGPQSVFDEGVEHCLDILEKKARVNAVFVYSQTYYPDKHRSTEALAPDHGVPVRDETDRHMTRLWHSVRDGFYRDTKVRHRRDPDDEFADRDVFETLLGPG
mgnify:FL=1